MVWGLSVIKGCVVLVGREVEDRAAWGRRGGGAYVCLCEELVGGCRAGEGEWRVGDAHDH